MARATKWVQPWIRVLTLIALATSLLPLRLAYASGPITEFPLTPPAEPFTLTVGPDGALWFTDGTGKIGRITTAGAVTEFPVPTQNSTPSGICLGPDGNLWFTVNSAGIVGKVTTGFVFTEFSLPTGLFSGPAGIAAGPDGRIWFAEAGISNNIGAIATDGTLTEYPIPTPASFAIHIALGPDNNLWFTEAIGNIGRITPAGVITEFPVPTPNSHPDGITLGPDGALWFTEAQANQIGRITTSGAFTEFPLPTPNSFPRDLTTGADGNLWVASPDLNQLLRITTSGVVTGFTVPTFSSGVAWVTAGPDGRVWFSEPTRSKIGAIATATTSIVYTGDSAFQQGASATLSARLTDAHASAVANAQVDFTLGSTQTCSGTTDASGAASCTIASISQPLGPATVSATFAGNAFLLGSSTNAQVLIYADLAHGAFVVGDRSAALGATVTFWGVHWAKANSLSRGRAPRAFKGFAPATWPQPPSCGAHWLALAGDNDAPATVPSYLAVLVASDVDQLGPFLFGNAPSVVVVHVDPGYAPSLAHEGTGTVVAVICP